MKYYIKWKMLGVEGSIETESLCDEDSYKKYEEYYNDALIDLIDVAYGSFEVTPQGIFTYDTTMENVIQFAVNHLRSVEESDLLLECIAMDDNQEIVEKRIISLLNSAIEITTEYAGYGEFDARLSGYVEACLFEFVKKANWHIGMQNNNSLEIHEIQLGDENSYLFDEGGVWIKNNEKYSPIAWYGLDGEQPLDCWTIGYNCGEDEMEFWLGVDEWLALQHFLGDFDDCFMIWYVAECGCIIPDIDEVAKECPFDICNIESVAEAKKNLSDYIFSALRREQQ